MMPAIANISGSTENKNDLLIFSKVCYKSYNLLHNFSELIDNDIFNILLDAAAADAVVVVPRFRSSS